MSIARQTLTAVLMVVVLTFVVGLAYPLLVTAIGQVFFPSQANGSLIRDANGEVRGSTLIAQGFAGPGYFHPRPSAAGADGYDAASSGGSNLGPTNKDLIDAVAKRAAAYRQENGLDANAPVPVDAVTASASGLDPDISPANALDQVTRVAKARNLSVAAVRALVDQQTQGRDLGFLGEPRVNVLQLNLQLDKIAKP